MKLFSRLQKIVGKIALRGAIFYLVICAAMFFFQRELLYLPTQDIGAPAAYGLSDFAEITLHSEDGESLAVWQHDAKDGYPTLLYFHGNGGNLSHRANYFRQLADSGFGIIGLDYRGYGKSSGNPSEEGLYMDARALIDYAETKIGLAPEQMIFYGESLGTGVAVQMATETKAAGLILQSPFTSIAAAGQTHYPWLPVSLLLKDRFDSLSKIGAVNIPLLLMHGEEDSIVPFAQGQALFAAANEPKEAAYFPSIGHNDMDHEAMIARLRPFCSAHHLCD